MKFRNLALGSVAAVAYLAMACSDKPDEHIFFSPTPSQVASVTPTTSSTRESLTGSVADAVDCTPRCVLEEGEVGRNGLQYIVFEREPGKHLRFTIEDHVSQDVKQYNASLAPGQSFLAPNGVALALVDYDTPRATPNAPIPSTRAEVYMLTGEACELTEEIPVGETRSFDLDGTDHRIRAVVAADTLAVLSVDDSPTAPLPVGEIAYGSDIAFKICDISQDSVSISKPQ